MKGGEVRVDFTELNELNPFFEDQEKIINATVVNSFVKGANFAKKELKKSTPSSLKKFNETLATKRLKPTNGLLQVLVGYFGRKIFYVNKRGVKWDAYYLLYWSNYGTLKNRASDHQFKYGVRTKIPISKKGLKLLPSSMKRGGIMPVKFFDKTADMVMQPAFNEVDKNIEKELNKQVIKYGFK